MKKLVGLSLVIIMTFLAGCKSESEVSNTDKPYRTAFMMDFLTASDENYYKKDFEQLFVEGKDEEFIREKYDMVKQIGNSSGSLATNMVLVRYENNQALMVILNYDTDTDEYLIDDVLEVPEEVASFFEEEL